MKEPEVNREELAKIISTLGDDYVKGFELLERHIKLVAIRYAIEQITSVKTK